MHVCFTSKGDGGIGKWEGERGEGEKIKKSDQEMYRRTEVGRWRYIKGNFS